MEKLSEKKNKKSVPHRVLRFLGKMIAALLLLLFLLILFIRSSWGQQFIIDNATSYVSDKTNTKVALEKFYLTFDGDLLMEGLHLEDTFGDTLVYSKSLEADIALWPLIKGEALGVDAINWDGLRLNIHKEDSLKGFNFQFLIDAFATEETNQPEVVDTTASATKIVVGAIVLSNFDIDFNDQTLGIESKIVLGNTRLEFDEIDLEKMNFNSSLIKFENTAIKFHQRPSDVSKTAAETPVSNQESEEIFPKLSIDAIALKNLNIDYISYTDSISAQVNINDFLIELPIIDMASKIIDVETLEMNHSKIALHSSKTAKTTAVEEDTLLNKTPENFEWPAIQLQIDRVKLAENEISYQVGDSKSELGVLQPDAIFVSDFSIDIEDIYVKNQASGLKINRFTFKEASGVYLENFGATVAVSEQQSSIEKFTLALNGNKINAGLYLNYASLTEMIATPEKVKFDMQLPYFQADIKELIKLQPSLAENENLVALSNKIITGNLDINGDMALVHIPTFNVNWGNHTSITTNGKLENLNRMDFLAFNFPSIELASQRSDLLSFINEDELGVSLPKKIAIDISTSGTKENIGAKVNINTTQGKANFQGNFKNSEEIAFNADLQIDHYKLGTLIRNEQLGAISLAIHSEANGANLNELDGQLEFHLEDLVFNEYHINGFDLNGELNKGKAHIESAYKDNNINIVLNAYALLDSIAPQADLSIDLIGADLRALGLSEEDLRTGLKLQASYEGNPDGYDVEAKIEDGIFVYNNTSYLLGDVSTTAFVRSDTTSLSLQNKILDLELSSNADPEAFGMALQNHLMHHFYMETKPDGNRDVQLKVDGSFRYDPILKNVFLADMQAMETIDLDLDFNEKSKQLNASITAPLIDYAGNRIDSLILNVNSDHELFKFHVGFDEINAGPIGIKKTLLTGNQKNNEMALEFLSYDDDEKLMHIQSVISGDSSRLKYHILPEDFILNRDLWTIPASNEIVYTENHLEFNDFTINKNKQSVAITNSLAQIENEHVALVYHNFNLNKILAYLNPDEQFAEGIIDGEFIVENPFTDTGILADLTISDLKLMSVDIGQLSLDAKSIGNAQYNMNLETKGGDISFKLYGDYLSNIEGAKLNFDLEIPKFNMTALENFSQGELRKAKGFLTGRFNINGLVSDPTYSGALHFKNAGFEVTKLNTPFLFENETLKVDNQALSLENFTIKDKNKNTLIVAGNVGIENPSNPTFDLSINVDEFQLLDATEKDNDFLYGKAIFDVEGKLTGNLNLPKLNLKAEVNSATNITYVMPSASVNIEERDGIVTFVNRKNPNAILTRTEKQTASLTGINLSALLKIGSGAKVNIIIDKDTGDNFEVYGAGDFNFKMNPNGKMSLVGFYDVAGGHYEMNLYNVVDRKFELVKGSRISWSGDPLDAKLDIKTLYKVETSAASLMAAQTSGADPSVKSKFRQVLPFYVYLNVNGALLQPVISFNLDMPEDEQGAIGGQVYTRIQQLNQQETELNKQVFSLLVLNGFYPDPESDGSGGGAASIARDNINDALSDQLNVFSDKLLGDTGVELDFGLDSYTDYQSQTPTERTQLDIAAQKKLFDDRLIVRVGSELDIQGSSPNGENTPLIGNVSLEYILTEDGRYRLKGFRRNQFDNVIDGQTIASGIGIIFTQEFNKFSELKEAIFLKKKSKEKEALESTEGNNSNH